MELGTVVKRVPNGILYSSGCIRIDNVRASYPHLSRPFKGKNDKGEEQSKFGIKGMAPKSTHGKVKELIDEAIRNLLESNKTKDGVPQVAAAKKFCRDGNQEEAEIYRDHWIIAANETRKPVVRSEDGSKVADAAEIDELIKPGYWVDILIRPWYQDGVKVGAGYGKRVNAGLIGVRFRRTDETFGEGQVSDEGAWDEGEGTNPNRGDAMVGDDF